MSLQANTSYTYDSTFKSGEFHHAVLSISGTTHTLYLDGSAVNINSGVPNIFNAYTTINQTVIGARANTLSQAFKGIIGDVRVYNYAISKEQVSNLYLNRKLVVHYPFDTVVNKRTPNYALLQYDASFVGGVSITSDSLVGTNSLSLTNTVGGGTASQYVISSPGNNGNYPILDLSSGFTISCWIKTDGITNKIQRIFDIPYYKGIRGIGVDISGTNMIYSTYNTVLGILKSYVLTSYFWVDAYPAADISFAGPDVAGQRLMYNWKGHNGGLGTASSNTVTTSMAKYVTTGTFAPYVKAFNGGSGTTEMITNYKCTFESETVFLVISLGDITDSADISLFVGNADGAPIFTGRAIIIDKNNLKIAVRNSGNWMKGGFTFQSNKQYLISVSSVYKATPHADNTIMRVNGLTLTHTDVLPNYDFINNNEDIYSKIYCISSAYPSNTDCNFHEIIAIGGIGSTCKMKLSDITAIESYLKTKWNIIY